LPADRSTPPASFRVGFGAPDLIVDLFCALRSNLADGDFHNDAAAFFNNSLFTSGCQFNIWEMTRFADCTSTPFLDVQRVAVTRFHAHCTQNYTDGPRRAPLLANESSYI